MSDMHDPFYVPDKAKPISWADAPVGAKVVIKLDGPAAKVRARDYETNEPDSWPDGNPKFNAVLTGEVKGQRRSLWSPIPSALFYALAKAQDDAGEHFAAGGELTVEFVGTTPNKNPRFKPSRQFKADYVPPTPGSQVEDPWANNDEPPF